MIREYKIEVYREGRWWMIRVPDIDGLTQARRIGEIEEMATSLIAISTDTPLEGIAVEIVSITVPNLRDVALMAKKIRDKRAHAKDLEDEALDATQQFAHRMVAEGIPVRDVAELLGVSPQRVSQLANS